MTYGLWHVILILPSFTFGFGFEHNNESDGSTIYTKKKTELIHICKIYSSYFIPLNSHIKNNKYATMNFPKFDNILFSCVYLAQLN